MSKKLQNKKGVDEEIKNLWNDENIKNLWNNEENLKKWDDEYILNDWEWAIELRLNFGRTAI